MQAIRFLQSRSLLVFALSILLLVPCLWHKHIEAGDLASHTYNAWLAQLIERGDAPGLYLAHQSTNVLFDVSLLHLANLLGFPAAEKILVCVCALIFFWGAFALVAAAGRRPPWFLVPAIAMIAYGWTFQMGFMNYYLSVGLGFLATALFWRGRSLDFMIAVGFMLLAWTAHPMGFVCIAGAIAYIKLAEFLSGWQRCVLFAAAFAAVFAVHSYIVHHFRTQYWDTQIFYVMNGADQLVLYSAAYNKVAIVAILFGALCFLYADLREGKGTPGRWRFRTPLELWAILLFTAAMIPELIHLPLYPGPVAFPISRLTSITAVMGLCVLGYMRPRRWHLAGFAILAAWFFFLLYRDTGRLNKMEEQAENLVRTLPHGRRVVSTISVPSDSRIFFINHLVDRACIGRCFSYANYEPSFGQFRVRVRPGSPIVTDSPATSNAIEKGKYVVRPEDLPLTQIYQCNKEDWTRLCMRDLAAGEQNGGIGYRSTMP